MLLPALGKAKQKAQGIQCMSNHRQLLLAWRMYADENRDRVCFASNDPDRRPGTEYGAWVPGVLNFDPANTSNWDIEKDLKRGALWPYCGGSAGLFKCPADRSTVKPSSGPFRGQTVPRVRSLTLNVWVGGLSGLVPRDLDPAKTMGVFDPRGHAGDVRVSGNHAFVADWIGLRVIDVSDSSKPVSVAQLDTAGSAGQVRISGNYAYLGTYLGTVDGGIWGFEVLDVTDPQQPILKASYSRTNSWLGQFAVTDDYAYVASATGGTSGVDVLDLRDKSNPVRIATIPGRVESIQVAGNLALLASFESSTDFVGALRIFDVSNPSNPLPLVSFSPGHKVEAIDMAGNLAYAVGTQAGVGGESLVWLSAIDISKPSSPVKLGSYSFRGDLSGIRVHGRFAFLMSCWSDPQVEGNNICGIRVIDVGDPTQPSLVGEYRSYGSGIDVVGNTVYAADGQLRILELSSVLTLASPVRSATGLTLSWNGGSGIRLQKAGSLNLPAWQDVPDTDGKSTVTVPLLDGNSFFRVVKP